MKSIMGPQVVEHCHIKICFCRFYMYDMLSPSVTVELVEAHNGTSYLTRVSRLWK